MKFFVYILFSEKFGKTYVGQTSDIQERISVHNAGRVKSTKRYAPWKLIHIEEFDSRSEAMAKEEWYKTSSGRKSISKFF